MAKYGTIKSKKKTTNHGLHLVVFLILFFVATPIGVFYPIFWLLCAMETNKYNRNHPDQVVEWHD